MKSTITLFTAIMALITLATAAPQVTPVNELNDSTNPPMACYNIYCNPEQYGDSQCVANGCGTCVVGVNKCADNPGESPEDCDDDDHS